MRQSPPGAQATGSSRRKPSVLDDVFLIILASAAAGIDPRSADAPSSQSLGQRRDQQALEAETAAALANFHDTLILPSLTTIDGGATKDFVIPEWLERERLSGAREAVTLSIVRRSAAV